MKNIAYKNILVIGFMVFSLFAKAQNKSENLAPFDRVIISPHIQVTFKEGNQESIVIEENKMSPETLNIEVHGKRLHLFLDGAKITSPTTKIKKEGWEQKVPTYKGTVVKAIVTYKKLNTISLRGEQQFEFTSLIEQDKLRLKIYGKSKVYFNELELKDLKATTYGESYLEIKKGKIENNKFTAYGESEINTLAIENNTTKLTVYGEGKFNFNVSKRLKVSAIGEAKITYTGDAILKKGINIGRAEISRKRVKNRI